ncbi:cysteine-rich receptor-like protein kinase 2 isoform X3 [Vitis vinifera]|uniref:cysteine-rich receptor-like protein kinase 2 isoform X3 n=1 Tax=Vitis vinifera TaxID=29760 RepID=UPI00053F549F|nr:cysteine-rich receptor-like protein kinase 2 isoform X3 [Vitis vinifera]|eukprot:XP_010649524.1 PREDICTED: cysteine-rich receptor-like protein kinase 2 isoform X3 [Vitis vinifera]
MFEKKRLRHGAYFILPKSLNSILIHFLRPSPQMVSSISTLVLLLATISSVTAATANDNYTTLLSLNCNGTRAVNTQSFDVNFVDAMEIISQEIASSGFGMAESGENATDKAYGLGQCLNYLSNVDCRLCYSQSRVQLPLCLPSTSARVYLNGCFLRYGNYNFSEEAVDDLDSVACGSSGNVTEVGFRDGANGLIQNLTNGAYEDRDYYKEGNATISSDVKIYGVAQCWRSLNKSGCRDCLEKAREKIVGCFPASEGAALNAGCVVRYSMNPFYVASSASSGSSSATRRRALVATLSIIAAVLVIGAAILWGRRRPPTNDPDGSSEILRLISESHLSFKYDDLRKATKDFDLGNKIGQGGYGSVYKGTLPDGREIAVKRLFINTTQWLDQFFNEVNLISQVQHKNLVKLLGCSVEGPESLLVYEYLCNTSLDRFLFDSFRKKALDWGKRSDILVGTAEGLAYLHEASEVRIIHRDIKASNILLDERLKPKIADFGLARYFAEGQSHLSTGLAGTLGYMAPEYVVHGQLTEKADVYSYGILVLEVLTGKKSNSSVSSSTESQSLISQVWGHFNTKTLIQVLDLDLQDQCSEKEAINVFQVGLLCTQASPNLRPPMWKVVEMLTSKSKDLPLPTQPPFVNVKGVELRSSGSESSMKGSSSSKFPVSMNRMSLSIMQGR